MEMNTTNPNTDLEPVRKVPSAALRSSLGILIDDSVNSGSSELASLASGSFSDGLSARSLEPREDIDTLFEREKQKQGPKASSWLDRLWNYSKVVFTRESTYRGFVDLFAEDTPSLLIEALRGRAAFLEP